MSQKIKIKELVEHKDNRFYFDEITGDAWDEFVQSIKTSGVIEPVVVTQNKVIVSGHQRVRACKSLGIEEIDAEVRIFDSDDEILKCLIETNIRQRGIGNTNPVKFGRCIKELERIYGVRDGSSNEKGNNRIGEPQNADDQITQSDLASQLGISTDTLKRYKDLADSIPEIQSLVETGIVTPTTARAIMKKLPEFQQKELAEQFAEKGEKVSAKEVEKEIRKLKNEVQDVSEERDYLKSKVEELESREPEVKTITKTVEKIPEDYEALKKKASKVNAIVKDLDTEKRKVDEKQKKILELQDRVAELEGATMQGLDHANLAENIAYFCTMCNNFIGNVGGLVWLTDRIADMPVKEREMFLKAAVSFRDWASAFSDNLERSMNGNREQSSVIGISLQDDSGTESNQ